MPHHVYHCRSHVKALLRLLAVDDGPQSLDTCKSMSQPIPAIRVLTASAAAQVRPLLAECPYCVQPDDRPPACRRPATDRPAGAQNLRLQPVLYTE